MEKWVFIENIVTLAACAAIILGFYAMGAGLHSYWGLVVLGNLNYFKSPEKQRSVKSEKKTP